MCTDVWTRDPRTLDQPHFHSWSFLCLFEAAYFILGLSYVYLKLHTKSGENPLRISKKNTCNMLELLKFLKLGPLFNP